MDITVNPTTGAYINPEFAPLTTGQNDPGRTGGNKKHTLTKNELPSYDIERPVGKETVAGGPENIWSNAPGGDHVEIIPSGGGDEAFSILPPFQTVIFIEYIG